MSALPYRLSRILFALVLLAGPASQASPGFKGMVVTGTAVHPEQQFLLYREVHEITPESHAVRYLGPDTRLLAVKELRYPQGYNTPVYTLHDLRVGRETGSRWEQGQFVVFRQEGDTKPEIQEIQPAPDLVIDAGFDHFIREHWEKLADGQPLPFEFAVANPLMTLAMEMREVPANDSAIPDKRNDYRYFVASSRSTFFGWAIPEIHVAYDREQRLLRIYKGLSNIASDTDNRLAVLIHYDYQFRDYPSQPLAEGDRNP